MSFERPSVGVLVFQCDACFDTFEFSKAEGDDITDFRVCWSKLHGDEGWSLATAARGANASGADTEHFCSDCTQIKKSERANPFRR